MGREKPRGEDGYSLIETVVVMTIMTIVMAVFTTMILMIYRTVNSVEIKSVGQTQIATALQRLDRELRYAKGISVPYSIGGEPYIDFLATQQGVATCIQVRVAGGVLAQRTWPYAATGTPTPSAWGALASGITNYSTASASTPPSGPPVWTAPFVYAGPTPATGYQQLTVTLMIGTDKNSATFTALNSTRSTSNDYCNSARS